MSWEEQGRQSHGWFGHGTSAKDDDSQSSTTSPVPARLAERTAQVAFGAVGALPSGARRGFERHLAEGGLTDLQSCMPAWTATSDLPPDRFRTAMFGPDARADATLLLQHMAATTRDARDHADLAEASEDLAAAVRCTGEGNWPRFIQAASITAASATGSGLLDGLVASLERAALATAIAPLARVLASPLGAVVAGVLIPKTVGDGTLTGQGLPIGGGTVVEARRSDAEGPDENGVESESLPRPPPGSVPIDESPWSGDHGVIKKALQAKGKDNVRISPNGDVWGETPNGRWVNHGSAESFTGSGKSSGQRGKDRERRR